MSMPKRRPSKKSEGWFAHNWQFVVLVLVASATLFLVVLAFNRPAPVFSPSTPGPLFPSSTPTASTPSPTPAPAVVAFLGDSYTTGTGATTTASRWSTVMTTSNGWVEENFGVDGSGYATAGGGGGSTYLDRVGDVIAARPQLVIVSGGRFDYSGSSTASDVSASIAQTFALLREGLPNATIIALGPIWDSSSAPERLLEISEEVKASVESVAGVFADIGQPLAEQPDLIGEDGILPNDAGHRALSATIARAVAPIFPVHD